MRVMVTGATGFTGSHTVRALIAAGHDVRPFVRSKDKLALIFGADSPACHDPATGDVTNRDDVRKALDGCDAVAHTAALVDLRKSMAQKVLDTNRLGVEHVVGGAAELGLKSIVCVSSMSAFFDPESNAGRPLSIDGPLAPAKTAYAQSKADAERFTRKLQDDGAPIRVTYPVGILGPEDPAMSEGNNAIKAWLGQTPINTSSGLQILDVRDLAEVHRRLLEMPSGSGRYPAGGEMVLWRDFGGVLESLTGKKIRVMPIPGSVMRGLGRVGDAVKRVYDFEFPLTYEAMCFATLWPGVERGTTEADTGVRFRPTAETLRDTIAWLARTGHLSPKIAGKLAPSS